MIPSGRLNGYSVNTIRDVLVSSADADSTQCFSQQCQCKRPIWTAEFRHVDWRTLAARSQLLTYQFHPDHRDTLAAGLAFLDSYVEQQFQTLSFVLCSTSISEPFALGAKGHLPRGYIEDTLRFFKQFTQKVSRGYMLGSFTMYPPLWSKCDQGSHAGHFYNVPTKVATGYFLNGNPGFFHNSPHNVSTMCLSHSLRVLS